MGIMQIKYREAPVKSVRIDDRFWSGYQKLVREQVIPYEWEALNDRVEGAEPSHAVMNFKIAAGVEQGEFGGLVFQDSDLAKWMEAAAYRLATHPDAALEKDVDGVIELMEKAQWEDGYLNTYFTLKEPQGRWTNLYECHELYCAGHFIEAAVAYHDATGKDRFLSVMRRFADHICRMFGTGEGQLRGYCGHEEIELALVKLYRATGERKYLDQAVYFIDERGNQQPYYFDVEWEKRGRTSYWSGMTMPAPSGRALYTQSHVPVREQADAVGHAVRAVYLYTAMADIAGETGDESLLKACRTLWRSIASRRMYVTGGIGSMHEDEAFSLDYDLPNDTVYAETCASVGLIFFAHRMLGLEPKGEYADVMERALYNTVLAGMAQDGTSFFYVNPMEVWPEASEKNQGRRHILPHRPPWFGCACCPPNVARLLSSLGQYIYSWSSDTIYTHLYVGSELTAALECGTVELKQVTGYPLEGQTRIEVVSAPGREFALAVRVPGWCGSASVRVNGEADVLHHEVVNGYAVIRRKWAHGDHVDLEMPLQPVRVKANPAVRACAGKTAVQCGPFVYCLEECDNGNKLHEIVLPRASQLTMDYDGAFFGGANIITADGLRQKEGGWGDALYRTFAAAEYTSVKLKFIPYYLWANRQTGEMTVWVREG